jgi:KaiC/GvpD/RAD55 family RecA-like ATPase
LQQAGDGQATAITGKAVHGLGGVGKTRLAVEFAWEHAAEFSAVLFLTAESPETRASTSAAKSSPRVSL